MEKKGCAWRLVQEGPGPVSARARSPGLNGPSCQGLDVAARSSGGLCVADGK